MSQPDPKSVAALTQQLVKLLANSEAETRRRAIQAAMTVLGDSPLPEAFNTKDAKPKGETRSDESEVGLSGFFKRDGKLKPSDRAFLCAAYHFSIYGMAPFAVTELRKIAEEAGEVLPDRVDSTMHMATAKGKKLFQPVSRGVFKPTVAAALYFEEKFDVKAGRQKKPKA